MRPAAFLAAVVQDGPAFLDLDRTVDKTCELMAEAARRGAALVAFPETWLPGYPVWLDLAPGAGLWDHAPAKAVFARLFENSVTLDGAEVRRLAEAASDCGCIAVVGAHERAGGTLYNTMIYVGRGALLGFHRKLMPTYTERLIWGQGDGSSLTVVDTPLGRVGGLICWEHWMPLARAAMHAKRELVHVAQWPACKEMNLVASRQYAFEGQCYVLAAGATMTRAQMLKGVSGAERELLETIPGADGDAMLAGGSAIIAPNGDVIAGPLGREAGILVAEIDPAKAVEGRLYLDTAGHYSRPDIFELRVNEAPAAGTVFEGAREERPSRKATSS